MTQPVLPRGAEWSPGGRLWRCANCGEESATGGLLIGQGFVEDTRGSVRGVTLHLQQPTPRDLRICGVAEEVVG